jgi:hypothetical protein
VRLQPVDDVGPSNESRTSWWLRDKIGWGIADLHRELREGQLLQQPSTLDRVDPHTGKIPTVNVLLEQSTRRRSHRLASRPSRPPASGAPHDRGPRRPLGPARPRRHVSAHARLARVTLRGDVSLRPRVVGVARPRLPSRRPLRRGPTWHLLLRASPGGIRTVMSVPRTASDIV